MTVATDLVRATRLRAGLSQAELARRAGIPRSVLNAYERGAREPGANALAAIVRAAGFELRLAPASPIDGVRNAEVLAQVLDLGASLPYEERPFAYPPFNRRVAS
jgi:transcriptional regulator with XRE-family HTH domain